MAYKTLLLILTTIFFWLYGSAFLDPDFGWHLRVGEIIHTQGIPKTDPFSYTMPSYQFVDHEWLTDVFLSVLYPQIGYSGLAFVFALIATSALFIQIYSYKKHFIIIPFLLVATTLLSFAGIRPQIISWFFFSLLIFILLNEKAFQFFRFFIPLIFLFWANMHGGFPIGLLALFIIFAAKMISQKKIRIDLILILFISFSATFINPYGLRLWEEIIKSIVDNKLGGTISEWMPMIFLPHPTFWFFVPFSAFFIVRYKKEFPAGQLLLFFSLLIAGLISRRHVPFFLILSLPMTAWALTLLYSEVKSKKNALPRLAKTYVVFLSLTIAVCLGEFFLQYRTVYTYSEASFYPKAAAAYLNSHKSPGNLCSTYNWGGYLIWKLPQKKVCIDGRMPSWKQKESPTESDSIMAEIQKLGSGEISLAKFTSKYSIDTLLIPQKPKMNNFDVQALIEKFMQQFFRNTDNNQKHPGLEKQLEKDNWIKIYEDPVAIIYFSPLTNKKK